MSIFSFAPGDTADSEGIDWTAAGEAWAAAQDDGKETELGTADRSGEFISGDFNWKTAFRTDAARIVRGWSDFLPYSKDALDNFVRVNVDAALVQMGRLSFTYRDEEDYGHTVVGHVSDPNVSDPAIFDQAWNVGLSFFANKLGLDPASLQSSSGGGRGGGGGGGGGARGPTADELRAMFD